MSACGLFPTCYRAPSPAARSELRSLFTSLVRDETPMARRAAAQQLGKFAAVLEPEYVKSEMLPLFIELTQDGEKSCSSADVWCGVPARAWASSLTAPSVPPQTKIPFACSLWRTAQRWRSCFRERMP